MVDLVQWLTAQLDEDERIARRAFEYASPVWHLDDDTGETVLWWPPEPHVAENERKHGLRVTADVWRGMTIDAGGAGIAPHIVVWDPARVLREIDAKRRIVDRYAWLREHGDTGGTAWVLPLLALPYADRPGYREEWRP